MLHFLKQSRLLKLIEQEEPGSLKRLGLRSLLAGLLQAATLYAIVQGLQKLTEEQAPVRQLLIFVISVTAFFIVSRSVLVRVTQLTLESILSIRMRIASRLRAVNLAAHDALPITRVQSALLDEQSLVLEAARLLVVVLYSSVMIAVSLFQALIISPMGAVYILVVLASCVSTLLFLHKSILSEMKELTAADQGFCASLSDLMGGYHELKLSRNKTSDLFQNHIENKHREAIRTRNLMEDRYANGLAFFAALAFIAVGIILFTLPIIVPDLPAEKITPLVMLAMAIVTPMTSFVSFIPSFAKSEGALSELIAVEQMLQEVEEEFEADDAERVWPERSSPEIAFEQLSISNATFSYADIDPQSKFSIHVKEFSLKKGELVFLRGGNGSGKTTFMTLLSGLYSSSEGTVTVNERPLDEVGNEAYRNLFSLIAPEPYLFPVLLARKDGDIERGNQLLAEVQLSKVRIDQRGRYSTTALSAGQRKRLALANALLEDRPIMLFDEVAADFDPEYREHFYRTILPELKKQGKTIVVISHDDRYFDLADRLLHMQDGEFV